MNLSHSLARWITNLLNVRFRYATRGIADQKRSFRLTLKRVLTDSGMQREPRLFDNIQRVREAIDELREAGFLDRGMALEQNRNGQARKKPKGGQRSLTPSGTSIQAIVLRERSSRETKRGKFVERRGRQH